MSATESGNDGNRLHGEMIEIKELLRVLIQSQTKQAESQDKLAKAQDRQIESQEKLAQSQAQQAKAQENIQNQMLEVLRSISSATNKQQDKDIVKNNSAQPKEITKAAGSGGGEEKQPSKVGTIDAKNTGKIPLPAYDNVLPPQDTKNTGKKPLPAFDNILLPQEKNTVKNGSVDSKEITKDTVKNSSADSKEIIKASGSGAGSEEKKQPSKVEIAKDTVKNSSVDSKEITKASGSGAGGEEKKQPSKVEDKVLRVAYTPGRSELLFKGDWRKTIEYLDNNPEALTHGITRTSNTVLHAAIYKKRGMMLIKEIVKRMSEELLEYRGGEHDFTPLHHAAQFGNVEAAVLLVNKNPKLLRLLDKRSFSPLDIALRNVSINQREIVEYLYSETKDADPSPFLGAKGAYTLCGLIEANFYDIALCHVIKFPTAATTKSNGFGMCGLEMMVRRPFMFQSYAKLTWWQNLIYSLIPVDMNSTSIKPKELAKCTTGDAENPPHANLDCTKVEERSKVSSSTTCIRIVMPYLIRAIGIKRLYNQKLVHQQAVALSKQILVEICKYTTLLWFLNNNPNIMKTAIKHGIIEIVEVCLEKNDGNLMWDKISGETLMQMAITERKENIVNLICNTSDKVEEKIDLVSRKDVNKDSILHYAAKLAPLAQLNLVSGAALQLQREMQWFKGIESILRESDRFARNLTGDTAHFTFTEAHKDLVKEGREWLKDTSGSCMIVGALIATVAFAAAFTAPGGNISDSNSALNGTPVFLGKSSFTVFAVADALALFSSIASVLMFLAIYTSRFAEIDFLKSLPQKLIFGLATLFLSMVAILVAFGASLFIVVGSRFGYALIPITLLSCCPLGLFAWLQLPLFIEMVRSTYWGTLFKKHRYIDLSAMKDDNKSRKKKKEN